MREIKDPFAAPDGAAQRSFEARQARLSRFGATAATLPEITAYTENPYRSLAEGALPALPLPDEPHVEAWRGYAAAADGEPGGIVAVLRRHFPQLAFPIAEGTSQEDHYRAATLRGAEPPPGAGLALADPEAVKLEIHPSLGGAVPVLTVGERADFVALVRALAGRNEPISVPDSMGACLIKGLNNWHRVALYKEAWLARSGPFAASAWPQEMKRLVARKELYQDRVLLLSSGPYSAVSAEEMGFDAATWREASLAIRRDHECFLYLTLRLFGLIRSNLLDELLADLAGMLGAWGEYRAEVALRFLGVEADGSLCPGGRLEVYRGEPPLCDAALATVSRLAVAVAEQMSAVVAVHAEAMKLSAERAALLLTLLGLGLEGLAAEDGAQRFAARWQELQGGDEGTPEAAVAAPEWSFELQATDAGVASCLEAFSAWAGEAEFPERWRREVALVLDEVLSNIAKYAYGSTPGVAWVTLARTAEGDLRLVCEDSGAPFDPLARPSAEIGQPLAHRPVGGLGIHLVLNLAREARYERRGGKNRLLLRFAQARASEGGTV